MNNNGHWCGKCKQEWTHKSCLGGPVDKHIPQDCPDCGNEYWDAEAWWYTEDSFTRWVKGVRKEAGV